VIVLYHTLTDTDVKKYILAGSSGVLPKPTMILDLQHMIKQQIKVRQHALSSTMKNDSFIA
jgi:tryptophan synthase beta subunit